MSNVLHKAISYCILISFTAQCLYPSYAWCMDSDEESHKSQLINDKNEAINRSFSERPRFFSDDRTTEEGLASDLASQILSDTSSMGGRRPYMRSLSLPLNPLTEDLETLPALIMPSIDTKGEDFDKAEPSLAAAFHLRDLKNDEVFEQFQSGHALYQNLMRIQNEQDEIDALSWSAYGIQFVLFSNGDLSVIGNPSRISPSVLRITNPNGHLHLCENLKLNHLLVKASSISHTGLNTDIKRIDVWATGTEDEEEGLFVNHADSNLKTSKLTVHEGRLQNQGQISGLRKLRVQSGLNQGSILSEKLTLVVDELFTNAKGGGLIVQTLLKTRGGGGIQQKGILKAHSLFIDNALFQETSGFDRIFEDARIGSNVKSWIHGNNATWTIKTLRLYGDVARNEATLKIDDLTNYAASLQNSGSVETKRLNQFGKTLLNEEGSFFDITEEAKLGDQNQQLASLINKGDLTLKGKSSGNITRLYNYGGLTLEGEHRFKGGILENHKTFTVLKSPLSLFEWYGNLFVNHRKMTLINASITAHNKFINHQTLITESAFALEGGGLQNDGTIQAEGDFSYLGKSGDGIFVDSETSKLNVKGHLSLKTKKPLTLKGRTQAHQGVHLSSPSTVNEGTFISHPTVESGTFIEGRLSNRGTFTADDVNFKGSLSERKLVNEGGQMTIGQIVSDMGLIQTQFKTSELPQPLKDRLSHLTVKLGTVKTLRLENQGRFVHEEGNSQIALLLNENGTASFDELFFYEDAATGVGRKQTLAGVLKVKHYHHNPSLPPLEVLKILGSVFFEKGNLQGKSLLIGEKGQFWLGEGLHQLEAIQNIGLLVPEEGADVQTESLDNSKGVIESETSLRVLALSPQKKPQTVRGKTPTITLTKGFSKDLSKPSKEGRAQATNLNPGTLIAKDDLILELSRSADVFTALDRFNEKWKQGRTLFLYGNKYLQTKDFTRGGHLFLTLQDFENRRSKLTTNTFDLVTVNPPIIGNSNEEIGRIWTIPDEKKHVFGDNHLTIVLKQGSFSFPYTGLFGHGPLSLKAESGDVFYGNSPTSSQMFISNQTQHCQGDCGDHNYHPVYYHQNNSSLASNSHMKVEAAPSRVITFGFTTVKGMKTAHFLTPGGLIENMSSKMSFKDTVTMEGQTYKHNRYDASRLFACPDQRWFAKNGFKTTFKDFNISDRAELLSKNGSLIYKTQNVINNASDMLAAGSILHNKTDLRSSSSFTNAKRELLTYYYDAEYAGGGNFIQNHEEAYGRHRVRVEEAGQIIPGHNFSSNADEQIHNGYLSVGGEVLLIGQNFRMEAFAHFLRDIAQYKNGREVIEQFVNHALQNNPLLEINERGDIVNAVPFIDPWLKYFNQNRKYMPMLENPGADDSVRGLPLAAPLDLQLEAFLKGQVLLTSKAYRKNEMKMILGDAMLLHSILAGRHEAEMGNLTESRLHQIVRLIGYFKPVQNKKGKPSLMLQIHCPDHEIDQEHGNAATIKSRLTLKSLMNEDTSLKNARVSSQEANIDLNTGRDLELERSKAQAKKNIFLESGRDTNLRSKVNRQGYGGNYQDTVEFNELKAEEEQIVSTSGRDLIRTGDKAESKKGNLFTARRNILTETLVLERQEITHAPGKMKKEHWTNHVPVQDKTDGLLYYVSDGDQHHIALNAEAKEMLFQGKSVHFLNVHNTHSVEEKSQETKRGFLSEKTIHKYFQFFEALSKGATLKASKSIQMIAEEGDINVTDISVDALELILKAVNGKVTFKIGPNYQSSFRTEQSSDMWWQRMTREVQEHQTYNQNKINALVKVTSKETLIELIRGETTAWIKELQQTGGKVSYVSKEEIHKVHKIDHEGPTAQLTAVIALAAGIAATASGAGTALAGKIIGVLELSATGTAAAAISLMSPAFIASLSSQAAIALASNRMDIGKAAEDLASSKVLKSIMITTVAAGFTGGLGHHLGIPTTAAECVSALDHAMRFSLQAGIEMGMSVLTGEDFGDSALSAIRNGIANTAGGILSNQISSAQVDFVTHKMLHAAAGAMGGMIANGDLLAGATGAVAAELFAHFMIDPKASREKAIEKAILEGKTPNKATLTPLIREEMKTKVDMARLGAAVIALLTKQDVNTALSTGTIAVENNCLQWAIRLALAEETIGPAILAFLAKLQPDQLARIGQVTWSIVIALNSQKAIDEYLRSLQSTNPNRMDAIPEDIEWRDPGIEIQEQKPTILWTPEETYKFINRGFEGGHIDDLLQRGNEGYQQYDGPDMSILEKINGSNNGRTGKQQKLRQLATDNKLGASDRGWVKQEINAIKQGKRETIRVPIGKELAHKRGFEAAKGYGYEHSVLQDKDLHKLQHKYDGLGKKNKTPNFSGEKQ